MASYLRDASCSHIAVQSPEFIRSVELRRLGIRLLLAASATSDSGRDYCLVTLQLLMLISFSWPSTDFCLTIQPRTICRPFSKEFLHFFLFIGL